MKKKENSRKKSSILRFYSFTEGLRGRFLLAAVTVVLSSLASYMTPQVVRVTVDSVINDQPFSLPGFLLGVAALLGMEGLKKLTQTREHREQAAFMEADGNAEAL